MATWTNTARGVVSQVPLLGRLFGQSTPPVTESSIPYGPANTWRVVDLPDKDKTRDRNGSRLPISILRGSDVDYEEYKRLEREGTLRFTPAMKKYMEREVWHRKLNESMQGGKHRTRKTSRKSRKVSRRQAKRKATRRH